MTAEDPPIGWDEQVRLTAYFLWEQDGRPEGRAADYWLRARDRHLRQREFDQMLAEAPNDGDTHTSAQTGASG